MEQVLGFVCFPQMKIKCDEWFEFVIKMKSFWGDKPNDIYFSLANFRDDFDKFNAWMALSMGVWSLLCATLFDYVDVCWLFVSFSKKKTI